MSNQDEIVEDKDIYKWKFYRFLAKNSHFAILALLSLCINFKNSFNQMTSGWVLWKTCYTLLLKKWLKLCPGPSMYLSERINWIILSFPHRISKILFTLGTWDDSWGPGWKIGNGFFFWYLNFWKVTVTYHNVLLLDQIFYVCLLDTGE